MDDAVALTLAAVRLEGLGARRLALLRDAFGTVSAAVEAAAAGAPPPRNVPAALFRRLPHSLDCARAQREARRVRSTGVDLVCWDDARYPAPLWQAPAAPPPLLYLRGRLPATLALSAAQVRAAAVIGTRRPTGRGVALARELAAALAGLGVAVVSGLALGIDGAAHEGALVAGGPTIAVLGGGHAHLHPPSHRSLAQRILAAGGALLSEYPPDSRPDRHTFPQRNRLISGLSRVIVVVEAGRRSGTDITVAHAQDQQRDVFACPGRPGDPSVAGTLRMIRDGALPVTELEDVLCRFRAEPGAEPAVAGRRPSRRALHDGLLRALGGVEDSTLDELSVRLRRPLPELTAQLTGLELSGAVVRSSSGRYRLAALERERRAAAAERRQRRHAER